MLDREGRDGREEMEWREGRDSAEIEVWTDGMEVSSSLPREAKISSMSIREMVEFVGLGGSLSCNIEQMRMSFQFSYLKKKDIILVRTTKPL